MDFLLSRVKRRTRQQLEEEEQPYARDRVPRHSTQDRDISLPSDVLDSPEHTIDWNEMAAIGDMVDFRE